MLIGLGWGGGWISGRMETMYEEGAWRMLTICFVGGDGAYISGRVETMYEWGLENVDNL